jgi:hypothetical protein
MTFLRKSCLGRGIKPQGEWIDSICEKIVKFAVLVFILIRTYAEIATSLDLLNRHRRFAFPFTKCAVRVGGASRREACRRQGKGSTP